jgi:hypothetical protein
VGVQQTLAFSSQVYAPALGCVPWSSLVQIEVFWHWWEGLGHESNLCYLAENRICFLEGLQARMDVIAHHRPPLQASHKAAVEQNIRELRHWAIT